MDIKEYLESEEHVCYSWAKEIARWFDYCVDRIDEKNKKIGYRKFSLTGWNLVHFNHRTNKIETQVIIVIERGIFEVCRTYSKMEKKRMS